MKVGRKKTVLVFVQVNLFLGAESLKRLWEKSVKKLITSLVVHCVILCVCGGIRQEVWKVKAAWAMEKI